MSSESKSRALVPITATGWRLWDLIEGRDLYPGRLTRGVIVKVDTRCQVLPDKAKLVSPVELGVVLSDFSEQALTVHLCTTADKARTADLLEELCRKYPRLAEHPIQINKKLPPEVAGKLLELKRSLGLTVILQHYNIIHARPGDAVLDLADQVLVDVGGGRAKRTLKLDPAIRRWVQEICALTPAPVGFAGGLDADNVRRLLKPLCSMPELAGRAWAFDAESRLRQGSNLDLQRVEAFADACVEVLAAHPGTSSRGEDKR